MNFQDYKGVWVFIEVKDGGIAPVSLELLGAGRKLADKRGVELAGVLIGDKIKDLTKTVFEYGAILPMCMMGPFLNITGLNLI